MDDKNTRVSALETYGGYGHISVLCRILSGVGPIPYTAIGIHTFQLVWISTSSTPKVRSLDGVARALLCVELKPCRLHEALLSRANCRICKRVLMSLMKVVIE